jgi:S-adenosylmethionine decarboxylase proenzyme
LTAGGKHLIVEFHGCSFSVLNDIIAVEEHLKQAALSARCTILHSYFHQFEPQGVTGFVALAESHISGHYWPEHGYGAVDIFMCGDKDPYIALRYLIEAFKPIRHSVKEIIRG